MSEVSSLNDPIVEVIREELRQNIALERRQHRMTERNKNRAALGEIVEDKSLTPQFVTEKARLLKKKPLGAEDYTYLQNALIQNEENLVAFLQVDNILQALARDLASNKISAQLSAASSCCNVALGNNKACAAVAKHLAPYLLLNLENLNRPLVEICAWTIGNLATGSDTAFKILHAQGCTKYLLSLLSNCDDSLLSSIIYASMHWVHSGSQHILDAEMVEFIKIILSRNIIYYNSDSVWLVALLSSSADCCKYTENILPIIMNYLYCSIENGFSNSSEVTASIRILGNTLYGINPDMSIKILLKDGQSTKEELLILLQKLISHHHNHVKREAIWLIANLYVSMNNCQILKEILQALPLETAMSSIS